ncbi:MAG: shikimate dehydrogenase family protein [Brevibacterium sp.]
MIIRAAVLGQPISHSKSPLLHRAAFAALGLDASEYERIELGSDDLEAFLAGHPDHTGFSLTMPLKDRLVELARAAGWRLDDTAALTGVGNTLVRFPECTLVANTDVQGIVRAIAPHLDNGERDDGAAASRAVILGAGATAASALVACRDLGVSEVDFLVRNPDRARRVLTLAEELDITAGTGPLSRIAVADIVISTLPAEAVPALDWAPEFGGGVALDVAYAAESAFLAAAASHGLSPVGGTAMLVEQAVAQHELFYAAAGGVVTAEVRRTISEAMHKVMAEQR